MQAQFNAIQREGNQDTALTKNCPLVSHGNILQRIMEREARQHVVQRDNEGQEQQSVNLYPTGKGEPLPNEIVDNFTQQGHPEVAKAEVHVDDVATQSIGAQAYTTQKKDIVVQSSVAKDPKVLTHEATHVVQQHNMDVQPTIPNTPINDTLEKDAQDNEKRISQNQPVSVQLKHQNNNSSGSPMIQRRVTASTFPEFLHDQHQLQNRAQSLNPDEHYTTVGFEHEFAQMEDGPLQGLTHVEVGESHESMPYTGINFKLETDAADALELVSPPFFVETLEPGSTIPVPEDVQKINRMITTQLQSTVVSGSTIGDFTKTMKSSSNLNFSLKWIPSIKAENKSGDNKRRFFSRKERRWFRFDWKKGFRKVIPGIHLKPSSKNGGISAQANIALGGKDIGKITELMQAPESSSIDKAAAFGKIQVAIQNKLLEKAQTLREGPLTHEMVIFIRQLARTLSGIFSVPSQSKQLAAKGKKTKMFTREARQYWRGYGDSEGDQKEKKYNTKFQSARQASSYVKDVQEVWIKDTIMNFGLGILQPSDWASVLQIVSDDSVRTMVSSIEQDSGLMQDMKREYPEAFKKDRGIGQKIIAALNQIVGDINSNNLTQKEDVSGLYLGPDQQPGFLSHDPKYIGVRQDTYLPGSKVRLPNSDKRTHVLETRRNIDRFIRKIDTLNTTKAPLAPLAPIPVTDRPEQDKEKLRKRYPIGSFIRYRVADQVPRWGQNHDIDCLAKVVEYSNSDQGTQYQIAVKGMRFVDSKTFNLISNDSSDYSSLAVEAEKFNVEEQGRTHFRMHFIQQGAVLSS